MDFFFCKGAKKRNSTKRSKSGISEKDRLGLEFKLFAGQGKCCLLKFLKESDNNILQQHQIKFTGTIVPAQSILSAWQVINMYGKSTSDYCHV